MSAPRVTAVVVDWNGLDDTKRCLEALERCDYAEMAVIVVDNGSAEPVHLPGVDVVRSERNLGFAGGANLGIRRALECGADYVWLLNNDTEVEPGVPAALVAAAEPDPAVGIVGGVLNDAWGAGRIVAWAGISRPATGPGDRLDYVTGACMLVRRAVFEEVGLFDEAYFFYYEDADLCLRSRRAGWRLAVARDAHVRHTGGASVERAPGGADRLQIESSGRFIGKHAGRLGPVGVGVRSLGIAVNRIWRGQARTVPELVRTLVRASRSAA